MKFLKLTKHSGESVIVNLNQVIYYEDYEDTTKIVLHTHKDTSTVFVYVKESVEDINEKVRNLLSLIK